MKRKVLYLFDMDGTLTPSRKLVAPDMIKCLDEVRKNFHIGLVGGSDLDKICEQMGGNHILNFFDYVFAENGLVAYKKGSLIAKKSILDFMGEEKLQTFLNFCLRYMSEIKLPAKRGNFIEFRTGMINVSPVGRSCSQEERDHFEKYDKEHKIRETFIKALLEAFPDSGLKFAIGGQISFDCFPIGWDKSYCLKYVEEDGFESIHFFGDKTYEGGNDYEIYNDNRVKGHKVTNPDDTKHLLTQLLSSL